MILKSLTLTNFQLFEEVAIDFQTINIFSGINHDTQSDSGNGSGKSTLAKNAISFVLYGRVEEYNIADLISLGTKKGKVEAIIEHDNKIYTIIREIPTKIWIYVGDVELKTATIENIEVTLNNDELKQKYLDSIFGDYKFFRQFRMIDKQCGIDLLNQGETAFRKTLMGFLEDEFSTIRQKLLDEKNFRELHSASKRPYPFYLSTKRKTVLDNGLLSAKNEIEKLQQEIKTQQETVNKIEVDIQSINAQIEILQNTNINSKIKEKQLNIENYNYKINQLKVVPEVSKIEVINYSLKIKELDKRIADDEKRLDKTIVSITEANQTIKKLEIEKNSHNIALKNTNSRIEELLENIKGLEQIQINTTCDKCGSVISEKQRNAYKQEKENELEACTNVQKNLDVLIEENETKLNKEQDILKLQESKKDNTNTVLINLRKELKTITQQNLQQSELLGKRETENSKLDSEIDKYNQLIESVNKEIKSYKETIDQNTITMVQLNHKIEQLKLQSEEEQSVLVHYNSECSLMNEHSQKMNIILMKLNESFKFSDYKYTKTDVLLYDEARKTFDDFAAAYIEKWLERLTVIINNLLDKVNIKAKFTNGKNFIEIEENKRQLKYNQLSSGQKTFVSSIFKLAILIYKGMTGIVLMDEGLADIDIPNLQNFIEVIKNLNCFQFFIVYQNIPELENVNHIVVERINNKSNIL